ncbi:hypothetical protein NGB36_32245 [Streptomyces sp. RB6PN25]|uniref:DUF916 domain-containing protein n=1 Tax=Streptomyces humicola TaxID=2953240 RepID=A0ABT1Q5C7_9ACTN|nr:hypothetical protein [Streptomyces humicola]MCQ4085112.1 hypothetical protein [Streptomyces humicola]
MSSLRTLRVAAAVATLLACLAVGGWTAFPAAGRPYFYFEGGPGGVLQDTVSLANSSSRAQQFTLFGADAVEAPDGSFHPRTAAESTDAGTWIRFASSAPTIPARTRADIPFTITVPAGTAIGSHPAAIVVKDGGGRQQEIPVHLRVTGPTLSEIAVEDVAVVGNGRAAGIRYTLVNRGDTALSPSLAVQADGLFGPVLHRAARPLGIELLPGRQAVLTEPWPDPPALDRVRVRLLVTADGQAQASATTSYEALPLDAAAAAAAAASCGVLGAAVLLALRRRRRPELLDDDQQDDSTRQLAGAAT